MNKEEVVTSLRLLIVGLGLIGGSLASALKASNRSFYIIGYDLNVNHLDMAFKKGFIDQVSADLLSSALDVDLVVIATPMLTIPQLLKFIMPAINKGVVVTDVGSCKKSILLAVKKIFNHIPERLVLAHPVAGSEKSGIQAADHCLFYHHQVIITPLENTSAVAIDMVKKMWQACYAYIEFMSVEHHDQILSMTSHLPHLLAFSLVDTLAGQKEHNDVFRYAAGGFKDFTRIAGSDATMWHDIVFSNQEEILSSIDMFTDGLNKLKQYVKNSDSTNVSGVFNRASKARQDFMILLENRTDMSVKKLDKQFSKVRLDILAQPSTGIRGQIQVAGDKSISHRSIMLGALAKGKTTITGFLEGEDSLATLQAFRQMQVSIEGPYDGKLIIHGVGMHGLQKPDKPLYLGNSGTAMRLLAGLMSAQEFDVTLLGDDSLTSRPMNRIVTPLRLMGAELTVTDKGCPPLVILGGKKLKGIEYDLPIASAQVQSSLLLAGLYAKGETITTTPGIVRDHTNRMLTSFGYPVHVDGNRVSLEGGNELLATDISIPGDISSAAFFMVAASISEGADLTLTHVCVNPTRAGVIHILRLMGADIELFNEKKVGSEPVADIRIRYAPLKGVNIPVSLIPLAIDEIPVLCVAAACAEGVTVIEGAKELRVKESDRIESMFNGLKTLGVGVISRPDGLIITGRDRLLSGVVQSYDDHRIAMAFTVASLRSEGSIYIQSCDNINTSFPDFIHLANTIGMDLSERKSEVV